MVSSRRQQIRSPRLQPRPGLWVHTPDGFPSAHGPGVVSVSPNPPKDTDGRREDSGRGVRELRGRWPGLPRGGREVGGGSLSRRTGPLWPSADVGPGKITGRGRSREPPGTGVAGTLGWPVDGSVADGRRQAGSGIACSRARARLNWFSQGQRRGRCRVRRRAERVSRPAREKKRRRRVLVVTSCSPRPMRAVQRASNCVDCQE